MSKTTQESDEILTSTNRFAPLWVAFCICTVLHFCAILHYCEISRKLPVVSSLKSALLQMRGMLTEGLIKALLLALLLQAATGKCGGLGFSWWRHLQNHDYNKFVMLQESVSTGTEEQTTYPPKGRQAWEVGLLGAVRAAW